MPLNVSRGEEIELRHEDFVVLNVSSNQDLVTQRPACLYICTFVVVLCRTYHLKVLLEHP